jgi:cell division protein FtsW
MTTYTRKYDRTIFLLTVFLIALGTVMLYSASSMIAMEKYGNSGFFLKKHLLRLLLGVMLLIVMMRFDYRKMERLSPVIFIGSIVLLLITLMYYWTRNIDSPARWLPLGAFTLQTSDVAKMAVIIYLAAYIAQREDDIRNFKHGLLPAIIMVSICAGLVVLQPDFSTAMTIGFIAFFLLYLGRAKILHLVTLAGVFGLAAMAVVLRSPYKLERITTFMNPSADILDSGYQIQQSLISLGNGGLFGLGLGDSFEKNLFLPEPHTDFIFAILGEELGFIGTALVLFLFLVFYLQTLKIARRAQDLFGMYMAAGIGTSIFIYAVLHAGVVTGIFPTTGLPMPFISYGGSQLVTTLAGVGIILNISRQGKPSGELKS